MNYFKYILLSLSIAFIVGCGSFGLSSVEKEEIPLEEVNSYLKKSLPQNVKADFGKMKITSITALSGDKKESIDFMVYFNIITFEIPEGLDGSVTFTGSLRYSPFNRLLYPKDLNATNLSFSNQSLLEYVSAKAKSGIPKIAESFLLGKDIYMVKKVMKTKKFKKFETTRDGKLILYFE